MVRASRHAGGPEPAGQHGIRDDLPLRGSSAHRRAAVRDPQPDPGGVTSAVRRQGPEVGRTPAGPVTRLRHRDTRRVEPTGAHDRPDRAHGRPPRCPARRDARSPAPRARAPRPRPPGAVASRRAPRRLPADVPSPPAAGGAAPRSAELETVLARHPGSAEGTGSTRPAAAAVFSRASACRGAVSTIAATCSVSAVAASTPRIVSSTGSGFVDHVAAPRTMSRTRPRARSRPRARRSRGPRARATRPRPRGSACATPGATAAACRPRAPAPPARGCRAARRAGPRRRRSGCLGAPEQTSWRAAARRRAAGTARRGGRWSPRPRHPRRAGHRRPCPS